MLSIQDKNKRLLRIATWSSVAIAILLIIVKSIAWWWTGSVSLLATLTDSCLDAVASIINLIAVHHALQPADKEHRFGHGKIESLAGLGQAVLIVGSGAFLLLHAVERVLHPQAVEHISVGIIVMIISIVATLVLLAVQRHVILETRSSAIKADSLHYKTDLLINASVIVSLCLIHWGWMGADAIFAILIVIFILHSAWEIIQESWHTLIDHELPDEDREKISALLMTHTHAQGLHDLRTRQSGIQQFIQLHLELDGNLTLVQAHQFSNEVEALIQEAFPNAEVLIHADPVIVTSDRVTGKTTCKPT
ncbi:MAG: cation diffusion facilitator family transporter [Mariprofundaceae bacterium]|nr:cation diffusion facilitator family transporter [Mariprofundaceae bacterium]